MLIKYTEMSHEYAITPKPQGNIYLKLKCPSNVKDVLVIPFNNGILLRSVHIDELMNNTPFRIKLRHRKFKTII